MMFSLDKIIKRVDNHHRQLVVEILSKAFDTNPSVNYVVKHGANRVHRIRKLMEYSFNICLVFGEVWITDDEKGCALVLLPDKKRTSLKTMLWDLRLAISCIGLSRVGLIMRRASKIKVFHPHSPFCYLWFIGVDPEFQGTGIGSELLLFIINRFHGQNRPIYLETSVEKNLSWYRKFGIEVFHQLQFPYTLYLLRSQII